jgi:hypothetical protein
LHRTKWSFGKKKKRWKSLSSMKQFNTGSVGNGENGYPVPDLNKTMINVKRSPMTTT